jgi:hypothetical protein
MRGGIRLYRELQLPDLQFEFGRERRTGPKNFPQLGLPRLRCITGKAAGFVMAPDDTPPNCRLRAASSSLLKALGTHPRREEVCEDTSATSAGGGWRRDGAREMKQLRGCGSG